MSSLFRRSVEVQSRRSMAHTPTCTLPPVRKLHQCVWIYLAGFFTDWRWGGVGWEGGRRVRGGESNYRVSSYKWLKLTQLFTPCQTVSGWARGTWLIAGMYRGRVGYSLYSTVYIYIQIWRGFSKSVFDLIYRINKEISNNPQRKMSLRFKKVFVD